MTTTDTQRGADGAGLPPHGPMTLEHLRLYGAGWCTEVTFALMCDVIEASDRRRQAEIEYHKAFPEAAELIARGELQPFTDLSVDAALAALTTHLTTTSREERS
jgi:hypothetical protein